MDLIKNLTIPLMLRFSRLRFANLHPFLAFYYRCYRCYCRHIFLFNSSTAEPVRCISALRTINYHDDTHKSLYIFYLQISLCSFFLVVFIFQQEFTYYTYFYNSYSDCKRDSYSGSISTRTSRKNYFNCSEIH